jgi:manganese transport protein
MSTTTNKIDGVEDLPSAGWQKPAGEPSMPEVFRSITVPKNANFLRRLLAFIGPGYLVAVGYMDPGNWATDIAGGAMYAYALLSVILISNFTAIYLQALAAKLGIVTERDLAQACRDAYSRPVAIALWLSAELGIVACDVAEVIGAAIALNLLLHIPLTIGVMY